MERSESIKHLAAALNKAQAEMSGAKKGATNPFFKSKYADLNSVVDAVRIPFSENGLSYSQFPIMDENRVGVETILMHESGEFIASTLMLPTGKLDAQAAGSAITYARRYSLQAVAGIPAEDDDGNGAVGGNNRQQAKQVKQVKQVDQGKLKQLQDLIVSKGYTVEQVCQTWGVQSLTNTDLDTSIKTVQGWQ